MPRSLNKTPKPTKVRVSLGFIFAGTLLLGAAFMGYNLKALGDAIHQAGDAIHQAGHWLEEAPAEQSYSLGAVMPAEKQQDQSDTTTTAQRSAQETSGNDIVQYHIIFSTGCNAFQDWQSYVFFYHAAQILKNASPPYSAMSNTHVTRIASGCNDDEAQVMKDYHASKIEIMTDHNNFHVHFTPDYSHVGGEHLKEYKYFNKPFGTKHWMENALGYNKDAQNNPNDDTIVVLLDPDQIILKPFTNDFSQSQERFRIRTALPYWHKVTHGQPFAQQYGFGNQWYTKTDIRTFVKSEERPSPLESMSTNMINENFQAGPPYLATAHDFYLIADKWSEFGPATYQQYQFLLAEMFAYCLAAAHLNLPHQMAFSFMVSEAAVGKQEGWEHIDAVGVTDVCRPGGVPQENLPFVLHYCQRYWLGKWFFGKYKLPKDIISCSAPLLKEPPYDIGTKYNFAIQPGKGERTELKTEHVKRHAFAVCHLIRAVNEAARFYKQHHCQDEPPNMSEEFIFHETLEIE